jgi:histidyl-tRNA synthetase
VIVGAEEVMKNVYNVKNLATGEQQTVDFDELYSILK